MRIVLLFLLLTVFASQSQAQINGSLKGRLVDSSAKQNLPEATLSVLDAKDSTLVTFGMSDKKGAFELKGLNGGKYILLVSFTGYQTFAKNFAVTMEQKHVDLGDVILQKEFKTLEGVVVQDIAPVKIKDDTISFKADAFKTKPNASVEDLLKKLPGVQVQKDGTVSAMGENVQKVYVDGKEFFGTDPKLATKNITADMVDQVQVFDDMSEQSKFTKIDDGSKSKTINIKLKKDRNKGNFGKINIGAGNRERYEGNLSFNHFKGNQRLSFLGAANNTNKQGFSFSDIISSMGGMGAFSRGASGGGSFGGMSPMGMMSAFGGGGPGFGGTGSGITSSRSAGVNYNDQWKKVDFRGSYFFSQSDNHVQQGSYRETYFPNDSTTETNTESVSKNRNTSHRFNLRWEYAVDSMNSFLYTANVNLQYSDSRYNDTSYTFSDALNDYLAITSKTGNVSERNGMNYNGELLYRKRFRKSGRTLTMGWRNGFNESESESFNVAPFVFYKPDGGVFNSSDQDYVTGQATRSNNNTLNASFTEGVGPNRIIELNYAYTHNKSTSDRRTYDFNNATGKYDILNLALTNYFQNTNISNRLGVNFREQGKKYSYQFGAAIQLTKLGSTSLPAYALEDTTIQQRFVNFFPVALFTYSPNKTKNVRFNYRGRTNAPSVTQLQDVPDVSNPLQVRIGNPSLKQEFNHFFSMNYSTFNIMTFRFFAANLSFNTTGNKIVNSIDSLNKAVTITKPVNMSGAYGANGFFSIGLPIKKLKGSNLNFTTIAAYNRDVSELYKQDNSTVRILLTQTVGFNYNKEKLDMGLNVSLTYNNAKYKLNSFQNTRYFTQTYSADASYTFFKDFILGSDFDYYINSGRTDGFNQNVPMWNAYLAQQFLKNKAGEIRFTVFDILNQNKSINRNVGDNYFEDVRSNVLRRYFLISFTYTLNKMKNQIPPQMQKMIERGSKMFRN